MDFDSILSVTEQRTSGVANIVSENHDIRSINWVRGMSDPGEMIACGAYQELRRLSGESDEVYASRLVALIDKLPPEHREKIIQAGMQAAIRRANYDTSGNGGKVALMVAGKAAWSGLGVLVREAVNSDEALRLSSTDWEVELVQLRYDWEGNPKMVSDNFALVRSDTGFHLATVGNRYHPIQNREAFEFMDTVLKEFGARYESAGSVDNGKKVFMVANLPQQRFELERGDVTDCYATIVKPHDFSGCMSVYPTSKRAECENTMRQSEREDGHKGIRVRHSSNYKTRIKDAQKALGLTVKVMESYKEVAQAMLHCKVNVQHYANDVLDACLDITQADIAKGPKSLLEGIVNATEADRQLAEKTFAKKVERRSEVLADILNRHESETCHPKGTLWGSFNASTESFNHMKAKRQASDMVTRNERRFESIVYGERDDMQQAALSVAKAYLAN